MKQVLINLPGNAVNLTELGQVFLEARNRQAGRLGELEVTIVDTGIGIPTGKLETVFLSAIENYKRTTTEMPARPKPIRIEMPTDLEDIVPGYLESRRKEISKMREMLADLDFLRLSVLAHNLKGTGGGYGIPALSLMGGELEQSAKRGDGQIAATQVTELSDYLDRVELVAKF